MDGRADDHLTAIREAIRSVDPYVPVFGVKTMEQRLADFFIRPRAYRTAVWMFAGFAILLALIGIYGIVSHSVAERAQEMGLRMALGATPQGILRMIMSQGVWMVAFGIIAGLAGAALLTRLLAQFLLLVSPTDPWTFFSVTVLLAFVALWACYLPARRAAATDPIVALRQ